MNPQNIDNLVILWGVLMLAVALAVAVELVLKTLLGPGFDTDSSTDSSTDSKPPYHKKGTSGKLYLTPEDLNPTRMDKKPK